MFEGVFCLCRGGCFLHYPLACEKDHIAPQLCQKEKDTEEKWGWMGVRVSGLAPSVKGHGPSRNTLKVLKSSTYNMYFKSYPVLRVLA